MRSPDRRVVVLGATGFVGSAVLRLLAERAIRVRAVSRRPAVIPLGAVADVEVFPADLAEQGAMAEVLEGADAVIHTVAHISGSSTWRIGDDDALAERVNVGLIRDLVSAAGSRQVAEPLNVVFAGAMSQIGAHDGDVVDGSEDDCPCDEYGRQKLAAERTLLSAVTDGLLRGTSLRLPTMYGYGPASSALDKGVVSTMVRRAVAGEPLTMWHDGTVRRDLTYVEDAAAALVAAAEQVPVLSGRRFVLGTGHSVPLGSVFRTVATLVAQRTGSPPVEVVAVPPPDYAEASDFRSITIDASAFRAATGWRPMVTLDEGLRRTVDFCVAGGEAALR
ncbi:oxidoreductase (plasmid) [Pseudonocardia sp. EC080610-09]|uniref:NAD-dependent epimerase/dehydratase family protein n=1 Tax=unclassified Pseudonocardia TaxID=2619320 RepID=UPI00070694D0|nr:MULTISPECIES: NAD-dependent epimerase/dehydratase [unclassified Pseudonocardia]ALL79840.1 oxidoreductase [Pseudonocardia sp. EC080610-09]ALL85781.1 oxidoreductase [Pseudonocardia sp. EC080619-01]